MKGHAIYPASMLDCIEVEWSKLLSTIVHQQYTLSHDALRWYVKWFDNTVTKHKTMPRAYLRRSAFAMHKLALLYHIFLNHGNEQQIGTDSYEYAEKIMHHFNKSAFDIVRQKTDTQSLQDLRVAEKYIAGRLKKGKTTTVRDIVVGTKLSTAVAKTCYEILCGRYATPKQYMPEESK